MKFRESYFMRNNWKNHISCLRRKLNVCFVYYVIIHSLLLLLHEKRKLRKTHSRSFQIMQRRNFIWLCTDQILFQTYLTDSTINIQIHKYLLKVPIANYVDITCIYFMHLNMFNRNILYPCLKLSITMKLSWWKRR